jgi:hypothetical protein
MGLSTIGLKQLHRIWTAIPGAAGLRCAGRNNAFGWMVGQRFQSATCDLSESERNALILGDRDIVTTEKPWFSEELSADRPLLRHFGAVSFSAIVSAKNVLRSAGNVLFLLSYGYP